MHKQTESTRIRSEINLNNLVKLWCNNIFVVVTEVHYSVHFRQRSYTIDQSSRESQLIVVRMSGIIECNNYVSRSDEKLKSIAVNADGVAIPNTTLAVS